jgi:peptidoglycan-associated lipoprotein
MRALARPAAILDNSARSRASTLAIPPGRSEERWSKVMRQLRNILVLALLAAAVVGCRGRGAEVETEPQAPVETDRAVPAAPPREDVEDRVPFEPEQPTAVDTDDEVGADALGTVYFAFDSSELSPQAISTLRGNADWLKGHSTIDVVVEGHCDERGTIEYNIALGERRASAVRDYMASLGVPRDRVRIVSYGEERPAEPGHGESAWSKNRRAEFVAE